MVCAGLSSVLCAGVRLCYVWVSARCRRRYLEIVKLRAKVLFASFKTENILNIWTHARKAQHIYIHIEIYTRGGHQLGGVLCAGFSPRGRRRLLEHAPLRSVVRERHMCLHVYIYIYTYIYIHIWQRLHKSVPRTISLEKCSNRSIV